MIGWGSLNLRHNYLLS